MIMETVHFSVFEKDSISDLAEDRTIAPWAVQKNLINNPDIPSVTISDWGIRDLPHAHEDIELQICFSANPNLF